MSFARRMEGVSESATLRLNAAVAEMKKNGMDVINLTAGEPDFNPPAEAQSAIQEAMRLNQSKYTPVAGIAELRSAIASRTNSQQPQVIAHGHSWSASNVLVTNGAKQAIFNALLSLVNPEDEVLFPAPYWLSYPEMTKIAGGVARVIPAEIGQGFKITPRQLQSSLTPRTRVFILNSPSNPTGAMYSRAELAALGEVIRSSPAGDRLWVISDEIYDRIILGEIPFCSFLQAAPHLHAQTITVNGLSKSAAMTGWRLGWSVAPEPLTQVMTALQGQCTSGVNSLAQSAALAVLKLPDASFLPIQERFKKRRSIALEILRQARTMELRVPDGAFYFFVGIRNYLKPGESPDGFAERVLKEARVALIPGGPFGAADFLRLSFATDEKNLEEGCQRLVRYLNS